MHKDHLKQSHHRFNQLKWYYKGSYRFKGRNRFKWAKAKPVMTLSWHSVWLCVQTRPLPLLGAPSPPPIFWVQLHLLKLTYLYPTAGSWTRASGLIQKPPEEFCGLAYKAGKNDNCLVPWNVFKSTFYILLSYIGGNRSVLTGKCWDLCVQLLLVM